MNRLFIFGFLAVALGILYLANLATSRGISSAFRTNPSKTLSITLFLTCAFIAAMFMGARYYNVFTRTFYTVTAAWMGFLFYLFIAAVVYGIVTLAIAKMYPETDHRPIGIILFSFAAIISVYGLIHSAQITVKNVPVTIDGLPDIWEGRRAVFVSDLHIGQLKSPSFSRRITEEIKNVNPDIIFIGGDFFDGTATDIAGAVEPWKELSPRLGIFFVAGNHEEFGDSTHFLDAIRSAGIRVLNDESVYVDDMRIIGIDYKNSADRNSFEQILGRMDRSSQPTILLKHVPSNIDLAKSAGITLQISGHTHRAQMWPLGYIPRFIYKGFDYGLKAADKTQILTSSGAGTWGPPLRVGTDGEILEIVFRGK